MSGNDAVRLELDGDLATVTIDRPERRNALDSAGAASVVHAMHAASARARVVILTGAGDAFCAGGDLDELERWSHLDPHEIAGVLYDAYQGMITAIRGSDAVVIAAINGAAVGAGLDLALACDLRIAAAGAALGQIWVRLGVIPGTGGAWLTQALAGPTRAAEMLLTGDAISAEDALAAGLVNAVVPSDRLLDEAHAWAQRILRHPRGGVIANKRALVSATEPFVEAALAHAREVQPGRFTSEEFRTALRAARGDAHS